jgi:hypothetical protein
LTALGWSEQCGLETVVVVTANKSSYWRKAIRPRGTAFPSRRFPVN